MKHFDWVARRLSRGLRVRLGLLVLALVALPAIFAELIAADAPVLAIGASGTVVLPAVVQPVSYRSLSAAEIRARHRTDLAWWPLVRSGPQQPAEVGPGAPVSLDHPLGTDARGRDIFARLLYGARTALGFAVAALAFALLAGTLLGLLAGYAGGIWDEAISRAVELVEAFPAVVAVVVVQAALPSVSFWALALTVAAVRWAEVARLVRAEVLSVIQNDFVLAAYALGGTHRHVLWRHVLPVVLRPLLLSALFGIASVVLLEVALSFLGLGQASSWGTMIAEGLRGDGGSAALMWAVGVLLMTVGAAFVVADATGEALDARLASAQGREPAWAPVR